MRAVVSIPVKIVTVGVTKHLMIDGQKRLTTLAIILTVLRDSVDTKTAVFGSVWMICRDWGEEKLSHMRFITSEGK